MDDYHSICYTGITDIAGIIIRAGKFVAVYHGDTIETPSSEEDEIKKLPWLNDVKEFHTSEDGILKVYEYHGKNIPDYYKKIAVVESWVTFYDDDSMICHIGGKKMNIFNASNSFLVQVVGEDK